jgi:hypothetical protein
MVFPGHLRGAVHYLSFSQLKIVGKGQKADDGM